MKTSDQKQRFVVSHLNDSDFKSDGLRPFFEYRDLGIAAATNGLAQAHVNRAIEASVPGKMHYHEVDFQFVYLLRGWVKTEMEGHGVHLMRAGSAWLQPPGMKHIVHDYSPDFELLEIVIPANFKTHEV